MNHDGVVVYSWEREIDVLGFRRMIETYQVDMSSGSMPSLVHSVSCNSAACSRVKQLLNLIQPCSKKWSICSCESWYCCSASAIMSKSNLNIF